MRVAVVAEFYPRRHDPVLGVWAHRQALAARDSGVDVEVFVLHRLVPPRRRISQWRQLARQPRVEERDGLRVTYVRYVSPPRARWYAAWGAWGAHALRRALLGAGPFDLVHAHNAVPVGDAVLRGGLGVPLVTSLHGGDVLWTVARVPRGRAVVGRVLGASRLVLCNSAGIAALAAAHGARETRVVHLGADLPVRAAPLDAEPPLLVSVGHLVGRKRHADVLEALARLPEVRYLIVGDGPERGALEALAARLGVADRVDFAGQLPPAAALERVRGATCFVMPSTEEAFGVAYVEAMAAGVPAVGCAGEPGPQEIAAAGAGIALVAPRDPAALVERLRELLADRDALRALGAAARATVGGHFTWERCGAATAAAYEDALR